MSTNNQITDPDTSNFTAIFDAASQEYRSLTKQDLGTHPFAAALEGHDSPDAILAVFRKQAQVFDKIRKGDDKLMAWLTPIVNILFTFSATLGEGIGLLFSPAKTIFTGICVLLGTVKDVIASYEVLVNLIERIQLFLQRLNHYAAISLTSEMILLLGKIMAQVISVLALSTKAMKERRIKTFMKRLAGKKDVEDALERLDMLTKEENLMTAARNLEVTHHVNVNVKATQELTHQVNVNVKATQEVTQRVEDKVTTVEEVVHGVDDNVKATQELTHDVHENVIAIKEDTRSVHDDVKVTRYAMDDLQRNQLRKEFRSWLSPPNPSINHNIACGTHHDGTATWFIQGSKFEEWKKNGSLLWVRGNPGSGKSIICSAIIEDVKHMRESRSALVAYYYFDFRDTAKRDVRGLLVSLLSQLVDDSDSCRDTLYQLYNTCRDGSEQPSESALAQCLKSMIDLPGQVPIFVIVDALDECPNNAGTPSAREKVLKFVRDLIGSNHPNLFVCITSRPEHDINTSLNPLTTPSHRVSLHDEGGQRQDIDRYVRFFVQTDDAMRRWRAEDKELVINVLSERAQGMFRWAFCQLDTLRRCMPSSIRKALNELPVTLDDTYERILQSIPKEKSHHAHRLFQCMVVARRPLGVEDLAEIFAIDFGPNDVPNLVADWRPENPEEAVLTACSTLIAIIDDEGAKIVQFSHFSVKEFLTSDRLQASDVGNICQYHIPLEPAHVILAQACLTVLLQLDDETGEKGLKSPPLASYAAQNWVMHAQFEDVASQIQGSMEYLFNPKMPHFRTWISMPGALDYDSGPGSAPASKPDKVTPLYCAASCGFIGLVTHLIIMHAEDVNEKCFVGRSPLHAASRSGHADCARILLDHGAHVNAQTTKFADWTPLHFACYDGHLKVAELLLEHEANLNAPDTFNKTPLHQALQLGRLEIVRLLLGYGADVSIRGEWQNLTPFQMATESGHRDVAQLLLEHDANREYVEPDSTN